MVQPSIQHIVLGRGMIYFDRFVPGTNAGEGERYIGNSTAFTIRRSLETVERLKSVRGQLVRRDELPTREVLNGSFTTDILTIENVSDWFGGGPVVVGREPSGEITETFIIKLGRYIQLGTFDTPIGVRNVDYLTFSHDGSPIPAANNIVIDKAEGRILIRDDAADLSDGDELVVDYQWRSSPQTTVFENNPEPVEGSLRFIATNPVGPRKNYFFPKVAIAPSGEASLKGDEWQQLSFTFESTLINPRLKQMYVIETAPGEFTEDELAIINLGGISLEEFPYWEDQLDIIVNTTMPSRGY
ncbi:MAG: hypothetical protein DI537_20230 [Stutzerimonas stutzeri]|nr:MAG: hypothetical protein DI537_20230 [Stutzerimonas stutzeri]